jgi:hypothetical protein
MPRVRRQAVPAATVPQRRARTNGRAVLRSPGSLSPCKITAQGALTQPHMEGPGEVAIQPLVDTEAPSGAPPPR